MCGVAGIYAFHYAANPVDRDELIRIRDYMRRRGPDAEGLWMSSDGRVGLGHRRLSIIDLSEAANQPMVSSDGKLVITFNGEIYNYRELRTKLEAEGHRFRTSSDTEVLLQMYRARGEKMFDELRGMYAFALWDEERHSLLLARDPYGIKPLYYADDGWTVRFASQVKALCAGGRISRDRDPAGVVGFYLLGSVPEPFTIYREIQSVPAGSFVWITGTGAAEPKAHFSMPAIWTAAGWHDESRSAASADARISEALLDSVRRHLVADVPVGGFLSAGIDSGALVGLMRDAGQETIRTVTLAFDEFKGLPADEAPLAEQTAAAYGTLHTVRRVSRREFYDDLPRIIEAMDQPTIDGINTWFVSKAMAEQGLKVALSGLGGDELFGGYPAFRDVPRIVRASWPVSRIPAIGGLLRSAANFVSQTNPKMLAVFEYGGSYSGAWFLKRGLFMPWELPSVLDRDTAREGLRRLGIRRHVQARVTPDPGAAFARVAVLESSLYMRNQLLRDTDWSSMAHSLEVRVPYVDPYLLKTVAEQTAAAAPPTKATLANAPRGALPPDVIHRAKTGFSTPIPEWLEAQQSLASWREIPQLRRPTSPWARRWSHVVNGRFAELAQRTA